MNHSPEGKKEEETINQDHIEEGKEIIQEDLEEDLDPLQDMILEDQEEETTLEDMNLDQEEMNILKEVEILEEISQIR